MTGQQLKNSILQLAIQGKLVPQNPDDEPASELLKRIREEKEKLIKEKKIKKEKPLPEITKDEKPFEIPENWVWCYMGDLFMHNNGKQLNRGNAQGKLMDYITTSNLYWDGFVLDNLKQMPFRDNEIKRCQALKGDLLICEGGDIGRASIWNFDYPIMLQNHIHKCRAYLPLNTMFFYYTFYYYNKTNQIGGKGIGIQGFSSNTLHRTMVPLPPLEEQHRIVQKIEELMPLVDEYDKAQVELNTLNANLPEALKKSILQEAIQGKLGTNNPDDEPASELLKRIREEKTKLIKEKKLKKGKYLYEIEDDELYIDIPDNWVWVRMQELCDFSVAQKRKEPHICMDAAFLRGKSEGEIKPCGNFVEKGAKIILVDGENSGEVFSAPIDGYMGSTFKELFIASEMDSDYITHIFFLLKQRMRDNKRGAAIPHLDKELFFGSLIPLPPLQEQHRIVEKLNEILPKLKNL